jgi:hypothetical protein
MSDTNIWRIVLLGACLLPGAVVLAEEPERRQLGAHVHGHGTFSMAIDGNKVAMELEAPGADIVGFEHAASTPEQKAAVDAARKALADAPSLFVVPAAAQCKLLKSDVALKAEEHDDGDDHDHDKAGHDKASHDDHASKEAGHMHHTEFHAEYTFECAKPAALTGIAFHYFKRFAGASSLGVDVVTAKGQSHFDVARDKPEIDLAGLM